MTSSESATTPGGVPPATPVGMGEIAVARDNGVFRTVLGSCVGLVLHDRRRRIGGLAHIVLPDSHGRGCPAGKYADTAVPEMLRQLRALADGEPLRLTARLAGGAKMLPFQTGLTIGDHNVQAIERLLAVEGIVIVARCCGGERGRRLRLDVSSGSVTIETVGGEERVIL